MQISARWPHTATAHTRLCGAHLAARGGHSGGPERLRQRWGERSPGAHAVHCRPMRGESDLHARLHDGPAQLRRAREPGERLALHLLGTTASPDGTASAGGRSLKLPAHSGAAGALHSGGARCPEMGALCTCRRVHTVPGGWAPLHPHSLRNGDSPLPPQSLDMCTPRCPHLPARGVQPGRRKIASRRQAIPALEPPALPAPDSWRPAAKSGGLAALPALAMLASLLGVFDVLHV